MSNKIAKQVATEIRRQEARDAKFQQIENLATSSMVWLFVIGALVTCFFSPGILVTEVINMVGLFFLEDGKLFWIAWIFTLLTCAGVFLFFKYKTGDKTLAIFYYAINNFIVGLILFIFSHTNIYGLGAFYGLTILFGGIE